jgi:hypothetical protein
VIREPLPLLEPGDIVTHLFTANADPAIRRAARLGDCWYVNPHNRIDTIVRQVDVYRRALDEYGKPFPLIMSVQWPGMPQNLALEQLHMLAAEVFPKVRQG